MKKEKSRFAGLVGPSRSEQDERAAPKDEAGKRARGYIQIGGLIPPDIRMDLRVALSLDPDGRDLSELLTDLLQEWLDSLPANVQAVRPSKTKK